MLHENNKAFSSHCKQREDEGFFAPTPEATSLPVENINAQNIAVVGTLSRANCF